MIRSRLNVLKSLIQVRFSNTHLVPMATMPILTRKPDQILIENWWSERRNFY